MPLSRDGIGREVLPEGIRVLQAAAARWDLSLEFDTFEWASCDYYQHHGQMMPGDWFEQLKGFDAIYFGAVGWPDTVPDHISLWGSLLKFRRDFEQYVNLRPVRAVSRRALPAGEQTAGRHRFLRGARKYRRGILLARRADVRRHRTRDGDPGIGFHPPGVDRILKYAFELAQQRPRKRLTAATKSNGMAISMPYWDERVAEMARQYPDIAGTNSTSIFCARASC